MARLPERDEWTARNDEEDDRQRRVEQHLKNEAKRIRFFGERPEPGLDNPYVQTIRAERPAEQFMEALAQSRVQTSQPIAVLTGEERAIAAVSRVGAQMRLDAEKAATRQDDDNER